MNGERKTAEVSSLWGRLLIGRRPKRTLARIITLILVTFVMVKYLFIPIRVKGISMEPNYHDGRVNLVNRLAFVKHKPKRGDVVAIRLVGERVLYMKRVVGLPGERVSILKGRVHINGQRLDEPYVHAPRDLWEQPEMLLRENQYFVIGDNRSMPKQLHHFGIVNLNQIAGKIVF